MTREEAEFVVKYIAKSLENFNRARALYRTSKKLRKGEDLQFIAEDYALWTEGPEAFYRRAFRVSRFDKIVRMMRTIDAIVEGRRE